MTTRFLLLLLAGFLFGAIGGVGLLITVADAVTGWLYRIYNKLRRH